MFSICQGAAKKLVICSCVICSGHLSVRYNYDAILCVVCVIVTMCVTMLKRQGQQDLTIIQTIINAFYFFFLLFNPNNPNSPEPRSIIDAGSGISGGV